MHYILAWRQKKTNKIEEFVSNYEKVNTRRSYRNRLTDFFKAIETNPDTYFKGKRDHSEDLWSYWQSMKDKTPCARGAHILTVKIFLEENDVVIKRKLWNKIKRQKKSIPATVDRIPKPDELKKILQHGNIKTRSLFLVCVSSGLRIDEALKLTEDDIVFEESPVKIIVRQNVAKNDVPRITYITKEAGDSLKAWLEIRDDWLKKMAESCNSEKREKKWHKDVNDKTIFCFNYPAAWHAWDQLCDKSGFTTRDPTTNIREMTIHSLRKYFMNRMNAAGVPERYVEQLSGHEGYLSNSYRRITEEELRKQYIAGMHSLLVFEQTQAIDSERRMNTLEEEVQDKDKEINQLNQLVDKLNTRMQLLEMKLDIEQVKNGNGKIEKHI